MMIMHLIILVTEGALRAICLGKVVLWLVEHGTKQQHMLKQRCHKKRLWRNS